MEHIVGTVHEIVSYWRQWIFLILKGQTKKKIKKKEKNNYHYATPGLYKGKVFNQRTLSSLNSQNATSYKVFLCSAVRVNWAVWINKHCMNTRAT